MESDKGWDMVFKLLGFAMVGAGVAAVVGYTQIVVQSRRKNDRYGANELILRDKISAMEKIILPLTGSVGIKNLRCKANRTVFPYPKPSPYFSVIK